MSADRNFYDWARVNLPHFPEMLEAANLEHIERLQSMTMGVQHGKRLATAIVTGRWPAGKPEKPLFPFQPKRRGKAPFKRLKVRF